MSSLNGMQLVEALEQHPITYDGQRVVTLPVVDRMHGKPSGSARQALHAHRRHFVEGKHFVKVPAQLLAQSVSEAGSLTDLAASLGEARRHVIALTEQGYAMVVKPFGDDLSWEIQARLADTYWEHREARLENERLRQDLRRIESALLTVLNARERESRTRASDHGRGLSGRKAEIAMQKQARDLIGQPFWSAADLFGQEYLGVDEHGQLTTEPRQIEGDTGADHAGS